MLPVQVPKLNPDQFSRYKERMQATDSGKNTNPIQKTDAAIKDCINTALWKDDVLRATEYEEIDVQVKNGVVYLKGHIEGKSSQSRIENAIRGIPEILGIINNLVLDDELTLEVAATLGKLEHIYDCKFFTGASHGVISLNGVVRNENLKLLAEKYAAINSNVRGVVNNVRVLGSELKLQAQQAFLQPAVGEIVYFLDGVSGVVTQVVINPNNRRVTAMIVRGNFTNSQREFTSPIGGRTRIPDQLVTVPMRAIRYLTKVSGFLNINSNERKRYVNFNPDIFFAPNRNWVPPYPYRSEDILIPVKYQKVDIQAVHSNG